jgi:Spy/CpxP family protein refolding chaperone
MATSPTPTPAPAASDAQYTAAIAAAAKDNPTGLASALNTVSSADKSAISTDINKVYGTVSSDAARNEVKNAQNAINNSSSGGTVGGDALSKAYSQISDLQGKLAKSDQAKTLAESNYSLSESRLKGAQDTASAAAAKVGENAALTIPGTTQGTTVTSQNIQAPTEGALATDAATQARVQAFNNSQTIIGTQLKALNDMVSANDTDSQAVLANIDAMTKSQTDIATKQNDSIIQAAKVAGIVSGRAMYSPEEHLGIIQEVMNDGQSKLAQINLKSAELRLEANKAKREYDYKAFTDSANLISKMEDDRKNVIVDMSKRLSEINADSQSKIKFDQEQNKYNADVQATTIAAMPEAQRAKAIAAAATKTGIDINLIGKSVADQVYERQNRSLTLQEKIATINSANRKSTVAGRVPVLTNTTADKIMKDFKLPFAPPLELTNKEANHVANEYAQRVKNIGTSQTKEDLFNDIIYKETGGDIGKKGASIKASDVMSELKSGVGFIHDSGKTKELVDAYKAKYKGVHTSDVLDSAEVRDGLKRIEDSGITISQSEAIDLLIKQISSK